MRSNGKRSKEEGNKVTGSGSTIIKRRERERERKREGEESPKKKRKAEIFPERSAAGIM